MEITNTLNPKEYLEFRKSVGWDVFPIEQAEEGIKHSYPICIRDNGKPAAMCRIIWDHGYAVLIVDVIVRPEYQGKGLGRVLIDELLKYINEHGVKDTHIAVELCAMPDKIPFYEKFGFDSNEAKRLRIMYEVK